MRTVCTPSMRSDNSLHAMSALWPRNQSPVRTLWERGGTPWALLGNATVAVGAPCDGKCEIIHHIFLYFRAIPRRSEKFQIVVPMPWDRGRVWQGLYGMPSLFYILTGFMHGKSYQYAHQWAMSWAIDKSRRFRNISSLFPKSDVSRVLGRKYRYQLFQRYKPASYCINAYTFMTKSRIFPPICIIILDLLLYHSLQCVGIWCKKKGLLFRGWAGAKFVSITMQFNQHSGVICLRSKLYLVVNSLRPSDAYMRQYANHHWIR